jgi:hypothetical protein
MAPPARPSPPRSRRAAAVASATLVAGALVAGALVAGACGGPSPSRSGAVSAGGAPSRPVVAAGPAPTKPAGTEPATSTPLAPSGSTAASGAADGPATAPLEPLPPPAPLTPFAPAAAAGQGVWTPAGRLVDGTPAVYETHLVPPGGAAEAGIAWMDTNLLSARLYSGSESPGGGPYRYTAPVAPADALSLVAAFNGGFLMSAAHGGYYTEGRVVDPLVEGAASLVIYAGGAVDVGAWGTDVNMTPDVVAVRQNLLPLVAGGQPTPIAATPDWLQWGATCGVSSCSGPGIEHQWRSGLGVSADGALVYVSGPGLDPLQLAELLVAAGVVRGMQLDINPDWPVFATYDPPPGQPASPANGTVLGDPVRSAATFFDPYWARDFVTMSARGS